MDNRGNVLAAHPKTLAEALRGDFVPHEPERVPFRLPEWSKMVMLGAFGGVLLGLLIGAGLAGVI